MSRIGNLPISIPNGVTVTIKDNVVVVKGPKGELSQKVDPRIKIKEEENVLHFSTTNGTKEECVARTLSLASTQHGGGCIRGIY